MAKHLEILNDNRQIIVDDQFITPMLLWKGTISTGWWQGINLPPIMEYFIPMYSRVDWRGDELVHLSADLNDTWWIPFDLPFFDDFSLAVASANLVTACRSRSGSFVKSSASIRHISDTNDGGKLKIAFNVRAESETQFDVVDVCVYSLFKLRPRRNSFTIYNAIGDMVFDALRPPLHFLGSLYGGVDASNNPARVYDVGLPEGIDHNSVFITSKSAMPYWAAYRIHSGGVSWADTPYKAVLGFPSPQHAQVILWRIRNVNGNNSSYARNLFFENLIYCPYPNGRYYF